MERRSWWRSGDASMLRGVMPLVAVLLVVLLKRGWVPSDEGTLAQSALRVYQGQLPHRDFAEIYTGGLAMWHALAFRVFGVNLYSLRLAVALLFLLWVPAVYWIARRALSERGALYATLAAMGWSYFNYVAAMPSWYNLFFATWGAAALLRFVDTRTRKWLVVAGVCGGLSVLVKVTGLYFVAGALIWFAWMEQEGGRDQGELNFAGWIYRVVCGVGLLAYLVALVKLIAGQMGSGEVYAFLLPSMLCVGLWFWRERGRRGDECSSRFARMLWMVGPFLLGVMLPVGAFVVPYVRTHSVGALLHGVFGSAGQRVGELAGKATMPGVGYALYAVVLMTVVVLPLWWPRTAEQRVVQVSVGYALAALVVVSVLMPGLQDTWMMAGMATPLVVALGVWRVGRGEVRGTISQGAMLLVALAAVCSLVQFPVSYVTYFCYVAPLVLLAGVAVVGGGRRPLLAVVMGFLVVFGFAALLTKHVYDPGLVMDRLRPLGLARGGGLKVDDSERKYAEIVPVLQAHSPNGLLYAGSDCPELYFLSGLRNPTRDDTGAKPEEIMAALNSGELHVVALNDASFFAASAVRADVRAAVVARLPHVQKIGAFSVYWD